MLVTKASMVYGMQWKKEFLMQMRNQTEKDYGIHSEEGVWDLTA